MRIPRSRWYTDWRQEFSRRSGSNRINTYSTKLVFSFLPRGRERKTKYQIRQVYIHHVLLFIRIRNSFRISIFLQFVSKWIVTNANLFKFSSSPSLKVLQLYCINMPKTFIKHLSAVSKTRCSSLPINF